MMRRVLIAWGAAACVSGWLAVGAAAEQIAVIVNEANDTQGLTSAELGRIYRGELETWPDGQRIVVVDRPSEAPVRAQFYRAILGADPTRKFLRRGSPVPFQPMIAVSDAAVRKFVARLPNAIGYLSASAVDGTVQVLTLDGRLPDDPGYALTDLWTGQASRVSAGEPTPLLTVDRDRLMIRLVVNQ
jgi:ABC-type phosphate transport system substrate-binding protein